jgi:hypothetical protein
MKQQSTIRWTALSFILLFSLTVQAQSLKEFFSNESTNALYLGVDFTLNKFIDYATANTADIRDRQYNAINDLIVAESKKYDIKGAFHRTNNMDHDLGLVNERNVKSNTDAMLSTNTSDFHRLKEEDIRKLVKEYNFKDKKGLGILLVCEAMSKSGKSEAIWAAIIDMSSGKLLFTDRVEGKIGMGIGFRNYYVTGIKNVLDQIEKKKYKEWKAKVGA